MARRYAHFAASHLAVYAANVESRATVTARPSDFRGTPNSNLLKALGAEDVGHPDTRIFGPRIPDNTTCPSGEGA
ncbi:MAG: hypothetical protein WBE91_20685 [Steroidobacteraceae bacterium]